MTRLITEWISDIEETIHSKEAQLKAKTGLDYTGYAYYMFSYKESRSGAPFFVHGNCCNMLMGDGHVSSPQLREILKYFLMYGVDRRLNVYDLALGTLVRTLQR